jgi:hypothetical protein
MQAARYMNVAVRFYLFVSDALTDPPFSGYEVQLYCIRPDRSVFPPPPTKAGRNFVARAQGSAEMQATKLRHWAIASRFRFLRYLPLGFSRCPLYPQKRTSMRAASMSALCQ